jgi:hypothetical protein
MTNHSIHCRCEMCREPAGWAQNIGQPTEHSLNVPIDHPGSPEQDAEQHLHLMQMVQSKGREAARSRYERVTALIREAQ